MTINYDDDCVFQVLFSQALKYAESGQWLRAQDGFEKCLRKEPNSSEALYNLGLVHDHLQDKGLALKCYEEALKIDSDFVSAHINRGILLHEKLEHQEAIKAYDRAISLNPTIVDAWLNKGNSLHAIGRYKDALKVYKEALEIEPQSHDILWNKSLIDLTLGDFTAGWQAYESRFKAKKGIASFFGKIRRLESLKKIKGKKILIWWEQGYGDSIQFCRFLNAVSELGGDVIFYVQSPLLRLLKESFVFKCTDRLDDIGRVDFQIPLLSLPGLFLSHSLSPKNREPYLSVSEASVKYWQDKLKIQGGERLNIGLAVSGSSQHSSNSLRSIHPKFLSEIDANFFLIQKDVEKNSSEWMFQNGNYVDCGNLIEDFYDSASIIRSMDVVMSVDTSLAHLSGALGIKTLLLLPYVAEWRWLEGTQNTPWYNSMILFRQDSPGDWNSAVSQIKKYIDINLRA